MLQEKADALIAAWDAEAVRARQRDARYWDGAWAWIDSRGLRAGAHQPLDVPNDHFVCLAQLGRRAEGDEIRACNNQWQVTRQRLENVAGVVRLVVGVPQRQVPAHHDAPMPAGATVVR